MNPIGEEIMKPYESTTITREQIDGSGDIFVCLKCGEKLTWENFGVHECKKAETHK